MEKPMVYISNPTLKDRSLIKTAVTLWSNARFESFNNLPNFPILSFHPWHSEECSIIEKVTKLPIPKSIKRELLNIIRPIGLEIIAWRKFHSIADCSTSVHQLCWTPEGRVDLKTTAEALIKDESLDVVSRYKVAALHCLESDVRILYNKIPPNCKEKLFSSMHPLCNQWHQHYLVVMWTYVIKGEIDKLYGTFPLSEGTPYQYAFKIAALDGKTVATKYFLQKLTPVQRRESLLRITHNLAQNLRYMDCFIKLGDVFCFLFTQLDEEQQMTVLQHNIYRVLSCFLYWPWQSIFMKTAKNGWHFLSKSDFGCLLKSMAEKTVNGFKDYNYQKLFSNFWQFSCLRYKRFVITTYGASLLSKLFEVTDQGNIALIMRNATDEQKDICFRKIIIHSIKVRSNSNLLSFFVSECKVSVERLIELKGAFLKFYERSLNRGLVKVYTDSWIHFLQFIDDLIQNHYKKRCIEDSEGRSGKRLCVLIENLGSNYNCK